MLGLHAAQHGGQHAAAAAEGCAWGKLGYQLCKERLLVAGLLLCAGPKQGRVGRHRGEMQGGVKTAKQVAASKTTTKAPRAG